MSATIQQPVPRHAVLYFRKAGEHRTTREPALRAYAETHDITIVDVYAEDGPYGNRRALLQLRQAIASPTRTFDTILHYDATAWGRFLDANEAWYDDALCRKYGVEVIHICPENTALAPILMYPEYCRITIDVRKQ